MTSKRLAAALAATMSAAAAAHVGQVQTDATPTPTIPTPTPTPSATPSRPLSDLDGYSLPADPAAAAPASNPTPVSVPTPRPSATPRSGATSRAVPTAAQSPTPAPTASAAPEPAATATPSPSPTADEPPLPAPAAAPPVPAPAAAPIADPAAASGRWLPIIAVVAAALALLGWGFSRRRSRSRDAIEPPPARETAASPPFVPAPVRPRLAIDLVPVRGGLTIISMVFEGDLLVRNEGDAPATGVLVEATLLPARSEQDAELGALFARPIGRPAVPAFTLAPGEERRVRIVAALPLAGVEPLTAGGRAMLVPVVAANVVYGGAEMPGQAAASWIVGMTREGSAKLAPFWMDAPRMSDRLGARPHALAVSR